MRRPLLALASILLASSAGAQTTGGRVHVVIPSGPAPKPAAAPIPMPPSPPPVQYTRAPPSPPLPPPPEIQPDAIIETQDGKLGGEGVGDGTFAFKAIPFARPPTGDLRWRPPKPPAPWQGVRFERQSAPACQQLSYGWNADLARTSSEDCLYLEVRTPDLNPNARLPVIVFIHGGANRAGGATGTIYSGFPTKGVVLVSIAYRLGVFGFLSHPALTRESGRGASGNYALMDQIAALKWVRANIGLFGGDPGNVTIVGHSAGAQDVGLLMTSPLAKGLFAKAVEESGPPQFGFPARTLAQNETLGATLAAQFSVADPASQQALDDLRHAPAQALQATADKLDAPVDDDSFIWDQATVDGYVLPRAPADVLRAKQQNRVPLLIGMSAQEIGLYGGTSVYRKIDDVFGPNRFKAMRFYGVDISHKLKKDALLGDTAMQLATDVMMRCPSDWTAWYVTASGAPAYLYQLDVTEGQGPVHHGSELSYVLNARPPLRHDGDWPPLQDYWVNFARTGDPNGSDTVGRPLTHWPAYGQDAAYLEFTDRGAVAGTHLREAVCRLLDTP